MPNLVGTMLSWESIALSTGLYYEVTPYDPLTNESSMVGDDFGSNDIERRMFGT